MDISLLFYILTGVLVASLILGAFFAKNVIWAKQNFLAKKTAPTKLGKNPPTVTLAIPARNETHALSQSLQAAIASDYPRLEILVLDDCSQDKTSEIIKSFAHVGVRFIEGCAPEDNTWLGKNHAYSLLEKQSTGDYIVFMGVDTHLTPGIITRLVNCAEKNSLQMISVLPRLRGRYIWPNLLQPMRYIWEILLARHPRPPVSSELWLIKRHSLVEAGGFTPLKQAILPEAKLAKHFDKTYKFIIAGKHFPVIYGKHWRSQLATSIRLWYPMADQQMIKIAALFICFLVYGLGPFMALFIPHPLIQSLALVTCGLYLAVYATVLKNIQPKTWFLSMWFLPLIIIQEAILVVTSYIKYKFFKVTWKGRNVCYPVLNQKRKL